VYSEGKAFSGWPLSPLPLAAAQAFTFPAQAATLIAQRPASQLCKAPGPRSTPSYGAPPVEGGDGFGKSGRKGKKTRFSGGQHAYFRLLKLYTFPTPARYLLTHPSATRLFGFIVIIVAEFIHDRMDQSVIKKFYHF